MSLKSKYEQNWGDVTQSWLQLDEVLSDSDFKSNPERWNVFPGGIRKIRGLIGEGSYKNVEVNGYAEFALVCNRSGGALLQGNSCSWYSTTGTVTSGTVKTVTAAVGSFVENEDVWNMLYILDDASATGVAPEGEWGYINKAELNVSGTHITFTVRTAESDYEFTVAPAVGDTFRIESRCQVIPCSAADPVGAYAGIVIRPDGIPDNYWGWICVNTGFYGQVSALIEAGSAITRHRGLRVANGADGATIALSRLELALGGSLVQGQVVAFSLVNSSADIVSDLIPVHVGPFSVDET